MHFILCYIIQISCSTGPVHRLKSVVTKTESLKRKREEIKNYYEIFQLFNSLLLLFHTNSQKQVWGTPEAFQTQTINFTSLLHFSDESTVKLFGPTVDQAENIF